MALVDPNGSIRRANRAFAEWAGLDGVTPSTRNWWNLVSPVDLGRALTQFGRLAQGAEPSVRFEVRIAADGGRWRSGAVWCKAMGDGVFLQVSDRTAQAGSAHRLASLAKEVEELSAEVATQRLHLAAAARLLGESAVDGAAGLEETCRLASVALVREPCDLGALVERAARTVERRLPASGATWSIAEMPPASLDAAAVSGVVAQLLEDATQSARERRVEAGAYLRNGVPVLFFRYEPHRAADKASGAIPDLGSPRRLAQRHGGDCWVEEDHGRITICLSFESVRDAA